MLCSAVVAFIFCILPFSSILLANLEHRFPSPTLPPHADGIVVLGGIFQMHLSSVYGQPIIGDEAERLIALAHLRRLYPDAKMVYAGGAESELARQTLNTLGTDTSRILFEHRSNSTREDALFARELVRPGSGEVWLLVTSAYHIPRSVGVFRALGWKVLPVPVGYHNAGDFEFDLGVNVHYRLLSAQIALREWAALFLYWMKGWTSELYPQPG
jgi:uncharacterized SAM-binding protein YcdF (DUF218 family)